MKDTWYKKARRLGALEATEQFYRFCHGQVPFWLFIQTSKILGWYGNSKIGSFLNRNWFNK